MTNAGRTQDELRTNIGRTQDALLEAHWTFMDAQWTNTQDAHARRIHDARMTHE